MDPYRLEPILSVWDRVRSQRGVQFRCWATSQLQELFVNGFVMDEKTRGLSRRFVHIITVVTLKTVRIPAPTLSEMEALLGNVKVDQCPKPKWVQCAICLFRLR